MNELPADEIRIFKPFDEGFNLMKRMLFSPLIFRGGWSSASPLSSRAISMPAADLVFRGAVATGTHARAQTERPISASANTTRFSSEF